jgi:hypothetical protein
MITVAPVSLRDLCDGIVEVEDQVGRRFHTVQVQRCDDVESSCKILVDAVCSYAVCASFAVALVALTMTELTVAGFRPSCPLARDFRGGGRHGSCLLLRFQRGKVPSTEAAHTRILDSSPGDGGSDWGDSLHSGKRRQDPEPFPLEEAIPPLLGALLLYGRGRNAI